MVSVEPMLRRRRASRLRHRPTGDPHVVLRARTSLARGRRAPALPRRLPQQQVLLHAWLRRCTEAEEDLKGEHLYIHWRYLYFA